jgi:hypothetical protein
VLLEAGFALGNGPPRAVHLTTAAVSCFRAVRVDLSGLRWYQKQAGLVGVLPNFQGAGSPLTLKVSPCRR